MLPIYKYTIQLAHTRPTMLRIRLVYLVNTIARRRVGQFLRFFSMEVGTDPITVT